ncbi:hypothetical protein R1sor_024489 [Riccia sorocarpa]|uniref:Uncharacterized protein n=1 Tax=Riccia sorocarpa TaxID=122646 RepID=A0ABD3GRF6_9MARC
MERFQTGFRGVVKLIPDSYHVDARAKKDVSRVLQDTLKLMNYRSKSRPVPLVCSAVSSALIALLDSSNSTSPVWSLPTFYEFCRSNHESLKTASPEILFTIHCRRKLLRRFGIKISNGEISCGFGFLKVLYDGYEVLVESDDVNRQHVDIMIKSSQPDVENLRTRTQIVEFVQEHFLWELQTFCASPSGCPGIKLTVGVLRTSSVQELIPIHERRGAQHCVELEELKSQFRSSIELMLQDMYMSGDVDEESLLNFQYTWPDGEHELAKDTLSHEDLRDVLSQARAKVLGSQKEVQTCSDELRQTD